MLFSRAAKVRVSLSNLVKGKQSVLSYEANPGWPFGSASDYKDPGMYAMDMLYNPKFTARRSWTRWRRRSPRCSATAWI